jgi:CheY-like chemotaxis protein
MRVLGFAEPSADGATELPAALPAPRRRVLLAEDNHVNQTVARQMLERLGCAVDCVENGRAALNALERQRYDLVFMDCQMPEMDGYEATRRLRAREAEQGGHVIVLALTANAMEGDRERCLASGMDDHLTKPLKLRVLADTLERWTAPGHGQELVEQA